MSGKRSFRRRVTRRNNATTSIEPSPDSRRCWPGRAWSLLVAATAHRRAHRDQARAATPHFLEVYVNTPLDECERRDTKGLFAKARAGELPDVPGIGTPYEPPENPDLIAEGGLSERAVGRSRFLNKEILRTVVIPPDASYEVCHLKPTRRRW